MPARIQWPLSENLYGGTQPSASRVQRWLKQHNLRLPVHIVVVELQNHAAKKLTFTVRESKAWIIDSDPGMVYITYNGSRDEMAGLLDRQSLLHGESLVCKSTDQWMAVLRDAIQSTRQCYLLTLLDSDPKDLTLSHELVLRKTALHAFQNEKDWEKSVMRWVDVVLMRNAGNLSNLRRKWVEFLSLATERVDQSDKLSFFFVIAVRSIIQTVSFFEFRKLIPSLLSNLHAYVMLDNAANLLTRDVFSTTVKKALHTIEQSYIEPITLSDISTRCFVSHEHLARIFKHETGYTVTEFLQVLRVDHAKRMLTETAAGMLDIAYQSGFNTVEHFHRVFKRHTKLTPLRYRKAHQL